MPHITDRDKLATQAQATIEWNFGQICDVLQAQADAGTIPAGVIDDLKRAVRRHGNNAIRVINGHLDYYNVIQRPEKLPVNYKRIVKQAMQGES